MSPWTLERAQSHLLSLELFGMRFGLERIRRLLMALGSPERGLRSVHVVGTNGKSSTVRMTAEILQAHGLSTGAFLSPHLSSFAERIRIDGEDLEPAAFAAAVERAADAAADVERSLEAGDHITQFELLTAAALSEFAHRDVDVAVVEAGLGGRHDATNVLGAPVVVLTSVGLEHTRWLGSTVVEIAREKLAVVVSGATLVVGALEEDVLAEAQVTVQRQRARLVQAGPAVPVTGLELPGYQRANFSLAEAAAEALIGPLEESRLRDAALRSSVPGRLQVVDESPLTVFDGAHNPAGVRTLVKALDEVIGERPLVAVVSVLDDKDAQTMLETLLPRCRAAVLTRSENPRCVAPRELMALAQDARTDAELLCEPAAAAALQRARRLAGPRGAVVATGSLHLVGELLSGGDRVVSAL
jgi:dihydrofolate synthase/folylpolyglutamate synthase